MSPARTSCAQCGAVLATEQEYCLACGARRVPSARERWQAPLIAATLTLIIGLTIAVLLYAHARSQAESDAKAVTRGAVSRRATPSGGQGAGAGAQQPLRAPSAAASSR